MSARTIGLILVVLASVYLAINWLGYGLLLTGHVDPPPPTSEILLLIGLVGLPAIVFIVGGVAMASGRLWGRSVAAVDAWLAVLTLLYAITRGDSDIPSAIIKVAALAALYYMIVVSRFPAEGVTT